MAKIDEIKNKQEARRTKAAAREKLTNWYMINMTWAFVGIIVLQLVLQGYNTLGVWRWAGTPPRGMVIMVMDLALWIAAGVFILGNGVLFYFWWRGGRQNKRMFNYMIFLDVCIVVVALITFWNQIRMWFIRLGIPASGIFGHSHWRIWFFMVGIGVWLLVALVIYFIKYRKIK